MMNAKMMEKVNNLRAMIGENGVTYNELERMTYRNDSVPSISTLRKYGLLKVVREEEYEDTMTEEEWDTMIDINLRGGWLTSKYVIPELLKKESGVIIYNSSVAGLRGFNRMSHYSASKHGLVGLAKAQAIELAPHNIRVLPLHPTGVNTPMNDGLAWMEGATPEEIAERSAGNLLKTPWIETEDVVHAVRYLASEKARYITGSPFILDPVNICIVMNDSTIPFFTSDVGIHM